MITVQLYDTTLRDGSQQEGISFSVEDKLKLCQKLDELGIDFIEGGWPGSNPKDTEFFAQAQNLRLTHSTLVAFGSTRHSILGRKKILISEPYLRPRPKWSLSWEKPGISR